MLTVLIFDLLCFEKVDLSQTNQNQFEVYISKCVERHEKNDNDNNRRYIIWRYFTFNKIFVSYPVFLGHKKHHDEYHVRT